MTSLPPAAGEPGPTDVPTDVPVHDGAVPRGFGPYRFVQQLGEGGMGEVWLAEQVRPVRRHVAIKLVKAGMDTAQVIARFDAERQALAVMDHPSIAKVFDGGTTPDGRPYFAMEYVRGEPITSYCDQRRLTIPERLRLFIQLCDGVQHAHQKGIIHRDLKPSNVLVAAVDDLPVPRIIDFGIAKAVSQPLSDRPLFTELGGFLGTPEYMSPEQASATATDIDTRSDVYSLGVLLYELVVGALPFDSSMLRQAGVDEIRRVIREKDPVRPSMRVTRLESAATTAQQRGITPARLTSLLRRDLDWVTMKALEKDRSRRYQTANALALEVRRYLSNEPVLAGPPSATYRARKFVRRHRAGVSVAAMLVALLIGFAIVTTAQAARIARERDRANREAMTATQVSDFLIGLFRVSDPSEARGNSLTAREILSRGEQQLQSGLEGQPAVRARLEATIGSVYTGLGLYAQAKPLLERALASEKRILGENDRTTLSTAHALANLYWYQGNFRDAEPLYRDVLERRERTLGAEHSDTLRAGFDLASLYILQSRFEEAERLGLKTLEIQRRVLGDDHPDTLSSLNNLQALYFRQHRYVEAEPIASRVLSVRRRVLGNDHPLTALALHNIATVYSELDRLDDAERVFREALALRQRLLGAQHPQTLATLEQLGLLHAQERRYPEAEAELLEAYQGLLQAGAQSARVAETVDGLVQIYENSGQPEKARDWRAKLPTESGRR